MAPDPTPPTKAASPPIKSAPVTATIVVKTRSFGSGALDDDNARADFVKAHNVNPDSVTLVEKKHNIGVGITYTFTGTPR